MTTELLKAALQRRDWILFPLISFLTVVLLLGLSESIARLMFASSKTGYMSCMVFDNAVTGSRGIPNSVCWEKAPESELVEYRFNSCGHRAGVECGPKPAGRYRIVMMGSSAALGQNVQREQTFGALLPGELLQRSGHSVELYNEGMGFGFAHRAASHFSEVLAAQPDLVLWVLTPLDISRGTELTAPGNADPGAGLGFPQKVWRRLHAAFASRPIGEATAQIFGYSKTAYMLEHLLFQSQSVTVEAFRRASDEEAGYLRAGPSAAWRESVSRFSEDVDNVTRQARAAGVPLVATMLPERAQASLISTGRSEPDFDPYKLNEQIRSIIVSRGGNYVDILPDFRTLPNPERLYFVLDGHLNPKGNAIVAAMLANGLASGANSLLRTAPSLHLAKREN